MNIIFVIKGGYMSLVELESGRRAVIRDIVGGHHLHKRLDAMGIKIGSEIVKVNQQMLRGPIIIKVYNSQVAIGYGMANKVIVEDKCV